MSVHRLGVIATVSLLLVCLMPSFSVGAQSSPVDTQIDDANIYRFARNSTYVFNGEQWDWRSVAAADTSSMEPNSYDVVLLLDGFPAWLRVDVSTSETLYDTEWFYNIGNTFGGDVTLYYVEDGVLESQQSLNGYEGFFSRPFLHRFSMFPLDLQPNASVQLLLEIRRAAVPVYYTSLIKQKDIVEDEFRTSWLQGIHVGVILGLALYHLMVWFATRDSVYIYYSAYLCLSGLYSLHVNGFGYAYIWPNIPWVQLNAGTILSCLSLSAAILFAINFLNIKTLMPRLTKFYYVVIGLSIVWALLRYVDIAKNPITLSLFSLIIYASFIFAALYTHLKGAVYSKYYLLAWTAYLFAVMNWIMTTIGGPHILTYHAVAIVQISVEAQAILLAFAMAYRIRLMREEKITAESDSRAKSSFLAKMSHEIRTPLSGILGMSELLSDRLKDKTSRHYNDVIRSCGTTLLTIINDILDYSKFVSGKIELEKISFDLSRAAVECLEIFRPQAADKKIELIADIQTDLPPKFIGDPTRIKQILMNLIGNAIKFTSEGQIVLRLVYIDNESRNLLIEVEDSGVGIEANDQAQLFDEFQQLNAATSREYGGTGLGLAICKQLTNLMGGEIGVRSTPGDGSCFWVRLPLAVAEGDDLLDDELVQNESVEGKRLLIVEDNSAYAQLLVAQANAWGLQCDWAKSGQEALQLLKENAAKGVVFDLVSLDLLLPGIDGLEVSRRMSLDEDLKHIPRMLLTAAAQLPPAEELIAVGLLNAMEKPTLPADLLRAYQELLSGELEKVESDKDKLAMSYKNTGSRLKVLVAEDNSVNQMVISGLLKRLGHQVELADNGKQAIECLQKADRPYDLILMDCEMPVLNGTDATTQIRTWEQSDHRQPNTIVALTAHAVSEQIDLCRSVGMDAYLTKPIELDKLAHLLEVIKNKHALSHFWPVVAE